MDLRRQLKLLAMSGVKSETGCENARAYCARNLHT